ncbi:MAG: hypothetical protein AAGF94_07935 [Pseudomonadota bacterium]
MSDGSSIFSFDTDDVAKFINANAPNPSAYYGNPNSSFLGRVRHEPYAFINMFSDKAIDRVTFSGGNFESDNHTVAADFGAYQGITITTAPVPVPRSLALLSGAFATFALFARRQRNALNHQLARS